MTKREPWPSILVTSTPAEQMEHNIYLRNEHERLGKDVLAAMNLIDIKIQTLIQKNKTRGAHNETNGRYYKNFMDSLFMNLLLRTDILRQGKDGFLEEMEKTYDLYDMTFNKEPGKQISEY